MKKILVFFALSLVFVASCSKFDDSAIWDELGKHEDRILKLETLCNQMNTNITSLQTIIIALQSNDYVVNIAPIKEGNKEIGYTIIFAKSGSITIYHGQDGENGQDGADGKDGYTPKIAVKQHTDGKYYWTLDGNWLLDDSGNMIPTIGADGKDGKDGEDGEDGTDGANGKDGEDGITPQLKIEEGYWYLSYDNGVSWQKLGKATGNNGLDGANGADGEDGDNIIQAITQDDENVYFTLTDGQTLTIMKRNSTSISFRDLYVEAICVRNFDTNRDGELSYYEAESVSSLNGVFADNANIVSFDELKYFTGLSEIEEGAFKNCTNLWRIYLPKNIKKICSDSFNKCTSLEIVRFDGNELVEIEGDDSLPSDNPNFSSIGYKGAFAYCESLRSITLPQSLEVLGNCAFAFCSSLKHVGISTNSCLRVIGGEFIDPYPGMSSLTKRAGAFMFCTELEEIYIPSGVTEIGPCAFYKCESLRSVTFADNSNLRVIGGGYYDFNYKHYAGAFAFCSCLESISIPASVEIIYNAAFYQCGSLQSIYMQSPKAPKLDCISRTSAAGLGEYLAPYYHFANTSDGVTVYVPKGAVDEYKSSGGWPSVQEMD